MEPTQQDIRTLHGVIMAIAEGRKGPARGGVLDGSAGRDAARAARASSGAGARSAAHDAARCAGWRGCCGAIRPTPSALLWDALTNDRRFAGRGFKRQTPVGPHIADFVSFPLRIVIELVPADESRTRPRRAPTRTPGSPSATIA